MTTAFQKVLGVALGLAMAGAALSLPAWRGRSASLTSAPVISESDGALKTLVIQYVQGADFAIPVYRDFLRQLPPEVAVHVVCPGRAAYDELVAAIGPISCRLQPISVGHAMTAWSRDRWVARAERGGGSVSLLVPRGEQGSEIWPARAGDQRLGFDLAQAMKPHISAERSELFFDGGDLLADDENVFVAPAVALRNVQHTVADEAELKATLARQLHRNIVLLPNAPDHHVGMYLACVGNRTALVGDPSLARDFAHAELPGGADFSPRTQQRYDSVAQQLTNLGYRVVRIPLIPAADGKTFFTYVNGIIDQRQGRRIVYMPVYRGCEAMNSAAESTWTGLGYQVHRVDCTSTYRLFGNLHCLVNVLQR